MDNRLIVVLSGGRSSGKIACLGLFLPGDIKLLEQYMRYQEFEQALSNVRNIMTATIETIQPIIEEFHRSMQVFAMEQSSIFEEWAKQFELNALETPSFEELLKEYSDYWIKPDPLPRPVKVIKPFNVHEAYIGRLNHKRIYYHCRSNC